MLLRAAQVLEIFSIISCLYYIYEKKLRVNIRLILLVIFIFVISELINSTQLSNIHMVGVYLIIFGYCKMEFHESVLDTFVNEVFALMLIAIVQYICVLPIYCFVSQNKEIYVFGDNFLTFIVSWLLFPHLGIARIKKIISFRDKRIIVTLLFCVMVVCAMIIHGKIREELFVEYFLLAVPSVIMLFIIAGDWLQAKMEEDDAKRELDANLKTQSQYDELLENVRTRQHEFKNHVEAILAAYYMNESHEMLMREQYEYYKEVQNDNRYNRLLFLGNKTLSGFLYSKFLEIEEKNIIVEYKISTTLESCEIPTYCMVEMIGILLDNARDASETVENGQIYFALSELSERFCITVRNKFPYVELSTIAKWMKKGISTKGELRGVGLYRLQKLCQEWNCDIVYNNMKIERENWIQFMIQKKE